MALQLQVEESLSMLPEQKVCAEAIMALGFDLGDVLGSCNYEHGRKFYEPVVTAVSAWLWDVGPDAGIETIDE